MRRSFLYSAMCLLALNPRFFAIVLHPNPDFTLDLKWQAKMNVVYHAKVNKSILKIKF